MLRTNFASSAGNSTTVVDSGLMRAASAAFSSRRRSVRPSASSTSAFTSPLNTCTSAAPDSCAHRPNSAPTSNTSSVCVCMRKPPARCGTTAASRPDAQAQLVGRVDVKRRRPFQAAPWRRRRT